MRTRAAPILVVAICLAVLVSGQPVPALARAQPGAPHMPSGGALAPDMARALAQAEPDAVLQAIIVLREQASDVLTATPTETRGPAHSRMVAALQALAQRTQAPVRARLEQLHAAGQVQSYTSFWIFNGFGVRATPAAIQHLAHEPTVATIQLDHYRQWISADAIATPRAEPSASDPNVEWGIAQIGADVVWASLQISGTGVTVAGMDTGVDWMHPALQANYRGYHPPGLPNHTTSWFDAVSGSLYPIDDHWHGTHTIGSAVGSEGIGVAPGAKWIAVKVLNANGAGYDSWIHAGFQWLLAPGGDPTRAPDIVNCSWGSGDAYLTTFQNDLQALRAVGIVPVFANGNSGPTAATVHSPASLPEALAVGAADATDAVASFSSRGPSPWGEIRPHVVAPGVAIRSSRPGGLYLLSNGTSMAAPHVAGVVALMRSVSPTLSITHTLYLITSTARPVNSPVPNNDAGWGRVDALAAVKALTSVGVISGTVRQAGSGQPITDALVSAQAYGVGSPFPSQTTTDDDGTYGLYLAAGVYDVTASAFGYAPHTIWHVNVVSGSVSGADFSLSAVPTGTLHARCVSTDGMPLTATLTLIDTPLQATASAADFAVPTGTYTLRARQLGYSVVTATVTITAGQAVTAVLALPTMPTLLLVDSGVWYFASQIGYYRQALDDLAYAYDEWPILHVAEDVPSGTDLAPYDVVIWSAPHDSPGLVGADDSIAEYLEGGGRLLLSGQDVGYLDGGGEWPALPYYETYLQARWVDDNASSMEVIGLPDDLFAGLDVSISGAGGADNQSSPDEIQPADADLASPVWTYAAGGFSGLRVDTCAGYRVLYFSFGFEGITDRQARGEVLQRSVAWLAAPSPTVGVELTPAAQTRIGVPGSTLTHTLRIRHVGPAGPADQFALTVEGAEWATASSITTALLAPCTSALMHISVTVPITANWDSRDLITVTARSTISAAVSESAVLTTKAPAPILLVDDDRFSDQQAKYLETLGQAALPYDLWEAQSPTGAETSPPLDRLRWYPIVVWWTGYDWYHPLTAPEISTLQSYLDSGGRLLLSSQDFLAYHDDQLLTRHYLGVGSYTEHALSTHVWSTSGHPAGEGLGPTALAYPFDNRADAVEPAQGAAVALRDQAYRAVALAKRDVPWATVFFPFPLEAVPGAARPLLVEQSVGYLSWIGGSSWTVDRPAASPGEGVTYTLRLINDGPVTVSVSLSNTLPISLALGQGSLSGTAIYTPDLRLIAWGGVLAPGAEAIVSYTATVAPGATTGSVIDNQTLLTLEDHHIRFRRSAPLRVAAPDLVAVCFSATPVPARSAERPMVTLVLTNRGPGNANSGKATIRLPGGTEAISGTLFASSGSAQVTAETVRWAVPIDSAETVSLTFQFAAPTTVTAATLYSVAVLEDGWGGVSEEDLWLPLEPWRFVLPVLMRNP